jgi:hypothetical protein
MRFSRQGAGVASPYLWTTRKITFESTCASSARARSKGARTYAWKTLVVQKLLTDSIAQGERIIILSTSPRFFPSISCSCEYWRTFFFFFRLFPVSTDRSVQGDRECDLACGIDNIVRCHPVHYLAPVVQFPRSKTHQMCPGTKRQDPVEHQHIWKVCVFIVEQLQIEANFMTIWFK